MISIDTLEIPKLSFDINGNLTITPTSASSKHNFDFLKVLIKSVIVEFQKTLQMKPLMLSFFLYL